jgi:hypothetical protein
MTDLSDTELAVENSKDDMRKYVQLIINKVYCVYRTPRLTIMEVRLNKGVMVQYTTIYEKKPETEVSVYLLVDGVQGYSPKLRCIYSPEITLDRANGLFLYGERILTTDDVFSDIDDTFSRELLFRRLDIYQDDIPKKK